MGEILGDGVNGEQPRSITGAFTFTCTTTITGGDHDHVNDNDNDHDRAQPQRGSADRQRMLSFQKLDVYRRSIEFLSFSRRLVRGIPRGNSDLVDQLNRSARSIPQNIAEGAGKMTRADKAKYYTIARGSAMESAAHLDVMKVDELIADEMHEQGSVLLERVVAMLTKMIDL